MVAHLDKRRRKRVMEYGSSGHPWYTARLRHVSIPAKTPLVCAPDRVHAFERTPLAIKVPRAAPGDLCNNSQDLVVPEPTHRRLAFAMSVRSAMVRKTA